MHHGVHACMGNKWAAVDEADRHIRCHSCFRRSKRWPLSILSFIMDAVINNVHACVKDAQRVAIDMPDLTATELAAANPFNDTRVNIGMSLIEKYSNLKYQSAYQTNARGLIRRPVGRPPQLQDGVHARAHLPGAKQRQCVECTEARTRFYCNQCEVALCSPCFADYDHSTSP